ncbi:acyl-CoA N-acyltransferase [Hypomontagnella submonticulosa]|nr:acyl-CoA N-acyltransferase [Hypomontagnella submonticulosa]
MSFELRKATPSDIPDIIEVFFDAFRDHPFTHRVLNSGSGPAREYWRETLTLDLQNPDIHYVVVTSATSPHPERLIAFGKWIEKFISSPPLRRLPPPPAWPKDADLTFVNEFLGTIERKHEEIMETRPHWCLDMLGVRREYQGRGIGKQLLQWGLAKVDDAGVESYLAASPAGAPLYAKHGFELVETILMDEGRRVESFMRRPARQP